MVAVAYSIKEVESYLRAILQWQLSHNFLSEIQRAHCVHLCPACAVFSNQNHSLRWLDLMHCTADSSRLYPAIEAEKLLLLMPQTDQAVETGIHLLVVADKLIEEIDELAIIALTCAAACCSLCMRSTCLRPCSAGNLGALAVLLFNIGNTCTAGVLTAAGCGCCCGSRTAWCRS